MMEFLKNQGLTNLTKIMGCVLSIWPEHRRYLEKSFESRDAELMDHTERLSSMIVRLSSTIDGGLDALARDYRFLCEEIVLPEELYFRREGHYRLSSFDEALRTVYANTPFMTRYMNGLLLSDILWVNHCRGLQHYVTKFLPSLKAGSSLLEIGPGHGLLLYLATLSPNIGTITAWDISEASLAMSRHALDVLGAPRSVAFEARNIFDDSIMTTENAHLFDGVVLSEVLEHLEEPLRAIRVLFHLCKLGGRVWINVPANSPAPDHLYLITEPSEPAELVAKAGFDVIDSANFPMTGTTLERAIAQKLTITCIVVGERQS